VRIGARTALAGLATLALTVAGPAALAQASGHDDHGHGGHGNAGRATKVFTLDAVPTAANPEGVAFDKRSDAFFVGGTGDGTIWRGTLDDPAVHVFIPGATGGSAVGMKVRNGLLYVAGGGTGKINVYNIADKSLVATFDTGATAAAPAFLNDLVVTDSGDVWVTDSFRPMLWHVTAAQVAAGTGVPAALDVSGTITFAGGGAFNLNGIVALNDGNRLIVDQSNTGQLWSIDHLTSATPSIEQVEVSPAATPSALTGADGMIRDRGRLLVVVGSPASVAVVKLRHHHSEAEIQNVVTDPTLRGPSTIARAGHRLLVVNADFATSTTPFTVSGLDRHAVKHGGHGGGHR
jgi:sugar lactone lactonase YvrE